MVTQSRFPVERFSDAVPASALNELTRIYQQAADRITTAVTDPLGGTARARQFNRARAAQLQQQIDRVLTETRGFTVRWAQANVERQMARGIASADAMMRAAGVRFDAAPAGGSFALVDRRAAAVVAADIAVSLDDSLSQQARAAQRFLRTTAQTIVADADISRVVARGIIDGDLRGTYRAMRTLLAPSAAEDFKRAGQQVIQVGNAQMTVKSYAEMLVRTRTREATVQARHERLVGQGQDLVSIVGAVSDNFCTGYLGRVYSITGRDGRYPSLGELPGGGPPFHPNCSKSTRLYSERFATDAQRRRTDTPAQLVTTDRNAAQRAFNATGGAKRAGQVYGRT